MFTPSFWSKSMPLTSSKQTTSYWATRPRRPGRVVHEHLGDGRLAARHEVRVGRDLLEQVRLARAARTELDHVVVALDERDHPQEEHVLRALGELDGSNPMLRSRRSRHCARGERAAGRAPRHRATSRRESWIGRSAAIPNGRPFASSVIAASYSSSISA